MREHAAAENSYRRALEVAQRQSAKFWELRAAFDLARLWSDQGKRSEARDLLSPIFWLVHRRLRHAEEAKALLVDLADPTDRGRSISARCVRNHGVSLDAKERSYFPVIKFCDAALWFARRGYVVVAPVRPGYGATAIEIPERGLFGLFYSGVGKLHAEFRDAGLAVASIDKWVIDYMSTQSFIKRDAVIIVGQSGADGGRLRLPVKIRNLYGRSFGFAAGRGGHLNGKPNNNCAPDQLFDAVAEFGRTARVPMLWIYTHNDSYFGPNLSKRLAEAFRAAGGNVE